MPRTLLPLHAEDISAFAKSLRRQLVERDAAPGHLELLNMLARSAGYGNFQHYRQHYRPFAGQDASVQPAGQIQLDIPDLSGRPKRPAQPVAVEPAKVRRLARYFDDDTQMVRWPGKFSHIEPCLWVVWSKIPPRETFTDEQMNRLLQGVHEFGDHALLRRALCDYGMVTRTPDCREYRRVEQQPSPEGLALLRHLHHRFHLQNASSDAAGSSAQS